MPKQNAFWLLVIPVLLSPGCTPDKPLEDEQAPVIQWLAPSAGAVFSSRDSISVSVSFTENTELHETSIWVWEMPGEKPVTNFRQHTHATELEMRNKFFYPVGEETELRIEVFASDHNGNETTDIRTIRLLP